MSAEVLRRAAGLMRELADKAAAQPVANARVEGVWLNSRFYMVTTPAREYALAGWLEDEAEWIEAGSSVAENPALAVARAYLGES